MEWGSWPRRRRGSRRACDSVATLRIPPAARDENPEIRLLLTGSNLDGDELEVAEITAPRGTNSDDHPHGATEALSVLEGELEPIVDGESEMLDPGNLDFVRPPSHMNHKTDPDGR